jgi:hypothetical protein
VWSVALYVAETSTLREVDLKYLESFEMCWRRMGNIRWTNSVRKEEVSHSVKRERSIVHTIKRRKANWVGHILHSHCLLKHVTKGKIERKNRSDGKMSKET